MRVLHLRASNFYGGPERQLHCHALAARGSGFEIEVASFAESGAAPAFLRQIADSGIATHVIAVRSAYDRSAPAALRALVRAGRFDILATHDYRSHLVGWLAVRRSSCHWLAFSRGFTSENLKVRLFQLGERFLMRFAERVVAVSAAQKQRLVASGVRADRTDVVHNAIDVQAIARTPAEDLRARYGFPPASPVVVAAGRFSAEKGQADLLRAARRVLAQQPQARFVLFGDGPDLPGLRAEIARCGQQAQILCPGFEANLPGCLKGADVVVNPSLSEGLPNIVLEAMALGVPVLATDVGGVPELVQDGVSGRLVPARQPARLAAVLLEMLQDAPVRARLARAGRERVLRDFSFEVQMAALASTYRRLVSTNR
jgi:glycosyltransferase involved in cell wall biosynthesis